NRGQCRLKSVDFKDRNDFAEFSKNSLESGPVVSDLPSEGRSRLTRGANLRRSGRHGTHWRFFFHGCEASDRGRIAAVRRLRTHAKGMAQGPGSMWVVPVGNDRHGCAAREHQRRPDNWRGAGAAHGRAKLENAAERGYSGSGRSRGEGGGGRS